MKQKTARIISLSTILLMLTGLFSWPLPVFAGESEWTAEATPGRLDNTLAPTNMDIRDFAIGDDALTIYAAPGDSIADIIIYKSYDAGVNWVTTDVPARADFIAVAPDDKNFIVITNDSTREVFISLNGGTSWSSLGTTGATRITDLDISEPRENKHYIAVSGTDATGGNLWFLAYGQGAPIWLGTRTFSGLTNANGIDAIAFSPDFPSDSTLAAVTDNIGGGIHLQLFSVTSQKWNADASYEHYPCTVVSANVSGVASASLSLSPGFDGLDDDYRNLYIGLTLEGNAAAVAASGIYRFRDITRTNIQTGTPIHSIAYGTSVVAGAYSSNTVYRITSPLTLIPTVRAATATKYPGGENKVVVKWLGSKASAGTAGNESSFSISADAGATFNDISLIDTAMTSGTDVAVSADGKKIYLATDDGFDVSLWRSVSNVWSRVFSLKNATGFMVRIERSSANAVYLVKKGGKTIYYNSSSGATQWLTKTSGTDIADMSVESTTTIYVLDEDGQVIKSAANGTTWAEPVDTGLDSGGMIYTISTGKLLATSQDGYVTYSADSGATWTKIPQVFSALGGKLHVVPDKSFASNKIIYGVSAEGGENIKKWQIGVSTEWVDIFPGVSTGGFCGLAINNDTLYAIEYNTGQSTLWRYISPVSATDTSDDWTSFTTTPTSAEPTHKFNAAPQALRTSTHDLWVVNTDGNFKLYRFTDTIVDVAFQILAPENGFMSYMNTATGLAYDISFSWVRPKNITEYEIRIAMDSEIRSPIAVITVTPPPVPSSMNETSQSIVVVLGPLQNGVNKVEFMPATTYYWKVRTTKPGYSRYSPVMSFTIEPAKTGVITLSSPIGANAITDTTPVFSWQPITGAMEYEFTLSDNSEMVPFLVNATVDTTSIQVFRTLENGKSYFWRVRAVSPVMSEWSELGVFTVAASIATDTPVDTTTLAPETPTQTEIVFPPDDTKLVIPGYLVFTIIVMVLLIAVIIFLIIRQPGSIFSFIRKGGDSGPVRHPGGIVKKPLITEEKPSARPVTPPLSQPQASVKAAMQLIENTKDAETVILAAKSFMWMASGEKEKTESITDKEREALGKKLAARIKELAAKEPLYIKHMEDAAMLFRIWARYGSRNETDRYLADSLKAAPDNAVRLIKCFLPVDVIPENMLADRFMLEHYKAIAEVIDPDKVYEALTKVFKFTDNTIEEKRAVRPADRNLAFKFMRIHLQEKK